MFEKAVAIAFYKPAVAVRGSPRRWGGGGGGGSRRMDWRALGRDLEEGCGQEGRRAKRLVLTV